MAREINVTAKLGSGSHQQLGENVRRRAMTTLRAIMAYLCPIVVQNINYNIYQLLISSRGIYNQRYTINTLGAILNLQGLTG